ncbi:MAG TPA: hypothetical protein PLH65_02665, partial [bacterium]|nr:hypothetical protein [bacterium]
MEKIKNIWRKFLHWYFFISLIIGFVMTAVIYSLASDNNVLTIRNHNLVLENQNLKSKLWQKNIDSPDDKQNLEKKPTMTPTAKPKETSNDSVESGGNLAPYSEVKVGTNNKTSKEILIKLYGGNNDKYLGDLRLNYYLQPVMDGVKILGIEQFSGCLPGAPRGHRGGKHQGLDHYTKDCGTLCVYGTPVKAIYPGVIIRIDHDYQEMTYKEINDVYNIMTNIGKSGV